MMALNRLNSVRNLNNNNLQNQNNDTNNKRDEPQSPLTPTTPSTQEPPNRRMKLSRQDRQQSLKMSIPELGTYKNNHVLVNRERARRNLTPFVRSGFLDELAQLQARAMADDKVVRHSAACIEELQKKLQSDNVAENVQCGDSIKKMHDYVMKERDIPCQNILGDFGEFGMATAKGADGKLYLCQLFRSCA